MSEASKQQQRSYRQTSAPKQTPGHVTVTSPLLVAEGRGSVPIARTPGLGPPPLPPNWDRTLAIHLPHSLQQMMVIDSSAGCSLFICSLFGRDTTELSILHLALWTMNHVSSLQSAEYLWLTDSHWDNERRYCGCVVCRSVPLQNTWILRPNYVALQHFLSGVFIFNSTDVTFLWMLTLTNCLCSKWKLISLWVFDVWAWADISAPPLAPWHTWPPTWRPGRV